MQIVIDIPEEVYRAYKMDFSLSLLNADQKSIAKSYLINGLISGIPLPKGHGDLIDADELLRKHPDFDAYPFPSTTIDNAPTIIEADNSYE